MLTPFGNAALTATTALLVGNTTAGAPIQVSYYNLANPNSTLAFFQFFDAAATTSVTLGTTAPTFWIAAPSFGGVVDTSVLVDFRFKSGVVVAATTTPTGNTALSSTCAITVFVKS